MDSEGLRKQLPVCDALHEAQLEQPLKLIRAFQPQAACASSSPFKVYLSYPFEVDCVTVVAQYVQVFLIPRPVFPPSALLPDY